MSADSTVPPITNQRQQWRYVAMDALLDHIDIDEMLHCYEYGPDPWLPERMRLDGESGSAAIQRPRSPPEQQSKA